MSQLVFQVEVGGITFTQVESQIGRMRLVREIQLDELPRSSIHVVRLLRQFM